MTYYAVIDTNVLVSALISRNADASTVKVLDAIIDGRIKPLYHPDIIAEYKEVLSRKKFRLNEATIDILLKTIQQDGIEVFPKSTGEVLVDMDDLIFYEVTMEKREDNAYLVTGNLKHYPPKRVIVTPTEMMQIINQNL